MEINLLKNNLKSLKTITEGTNNISYEWDIIVPDSKPDIHKILNADAVCTVTGKEIMQDRAMISGIVSMNVMYIPAGEHNTLKSIDNSQSFNTVLELEGLRQNMNLFSRAETVRCTADAINSRKIKIKCDIKLKGSASCEDDVEYINSIEGNDIEYLMKDILACRTVSESANRIEIREEVSLPSGMPSAEEIIKVSMKIGDRDIRPMNGKILVKGNVTATVMYNSQNEGDGLQFAEYTFPFTEIFEERSMSENTIYEGDFYLENTSCILSEDNEGERRILFISCDVITEGAGYENTTISAVVDAYGMESDVELEHSGCDFIKNINCCETRSMIKEIVDFGKIDEINKVINIIAYERINSVISHKNSVTVNGEVEVELLYNSSESDLPVSYVSKIIPFSVNVDCPGAESNSPCEVKTDIVSLAYNILNPTQLELRIAMDMKVRIKKKINGCMLKNITVSSKKEHPERQGMVVYFCDHNEKVWDIAKKYRTTVNDICEANELESADEVTSGTKLLIP